MKKKMYEPGIRKEEVERKKKERKKRRKRNVDLEKKSIM
jgi:hypothetical protein